MEKNFKLIKERPDNLSGTMICKINTTPKNTFSFLEDTYGKYIDLMKGFTFIDNKSNWEWFFESANRKFRVYDYRGSVSVGSISSDILGVKDEILIKEANELKEFIEKGVEVLKLKHRENIDNSVKENKFPNFVSTFEPVMLLLVRANKEEFLLEGLILSVSVIDALLRQCIMFRKQIEEETSNIFEEYIFQEENGPYFYESNILKQAFKRGIIDEDFYNKLDKLYKERNKAVHRYFISSFQYEDIATILNENIDTIPRLSEILYNIEEEQIKSGFGVTIKSKSNKEPEKTDPLLRISSEVLREKEIETPKRKTMFDD
jgi:uncharacterized protein YutE (UPF0331/DUF86 family)